LLICLCSAALLTNTVTPPSNFAPRTQVSIPTLQSRPTLGATNTFTPSPTVLPPTWTPEGGPLSNPVGEATATPQPNPT
jgi:hypothetical protein